LQDFSYPAEEILVRNWKKLPKGQGQVAAGMGREIRADSLVA
jgi:hypothetical protein